MNSKSLLYKVISILVFISIFFIDKKMLGIPVIMLLVVFCLFVLTFFRKSMISLGFFSKSKIKRTISQLLIFSIFTYIVKYVNVETIVQNYFYSTGEKPGFLYFKMCFNGIAVILLAYWSFSFGYSVKADLKMLNKIINLIINLTFFLALVNVITWVISTGGNLGRYNFKPLLILSYGTNIQWSILGFLLLLSKLENFSIKSLKGIKLLILGLSILIILSRLNQLLFLTSLLLYYYYVSEGLFTRKFITISITFSILLFLSPVFFGLDFMDSYYLLSISEGDDFQIRLATIFSSLNIFYNHL